MREVFIQPGFTETDFEDLLKSRQFITIDCYTIKLATQVILRSTTSQADVVAIPPGELTPVVYSSKKLQISGIRFKLGIGLDKDEQSMVLAATEDFIVPFSGDTNDGMPLMEAVRRGDFDRGEVTLDRYYSPNWDPANRVGCIRLFSGKVGELDHAGNLTCSIKVQSDLYRLDRQMPRNLYQPNCNNTFCDIRCGLSKPSYAAAGQTQAGTTASKIRWSGSSSSYALGTVTVNVDANTRYSRTVREADANFLYLSYPLDFIPEDGTNFTVYRGCARTLQACIDYGNKSRNYSFPFMPQAETAY